MVREVWQKSEDIPKGTSVLGIHIQDPSIIVTTAEDARTTYYAGDDGVISTTRLVFVQITPDERQACKNTNDVNKLAKELFPFVARKLGLEKYRVKEDGSEEE
jgi:hypothetical protein